MLTFFMRLNVQPVMEQPFTADCVCQGGVGVLPGTKMSLSEVRTNIYPSQFLFSTVKMPLLLRRGHIRQSKIKCDAYWHQAFVKD